MVIPIVCWHAYIEESRIGLCWDLYICNVKVYKPFFQDQILLSLNSYVMLRKFIGICILYGYGVSLPHQAIKMNN